MSHIQISNKQCTAHKNLSALYIEVLLKYTPPFKYKNFGFLTNLLVQPLHYQQ